MSKQNEIDTLRTENEKMKDGLKGIAESRTLGATSLKRMASKTLSELNGSWDQNKHTIVTDSAVAIITPPLKLIFPKTEDLPLMHIEFPNDENLLPSIINESLGRAIRETNRLWFGYL